jgi:glutathionyl-hydroquinone reductase
MGKTALDEMGSKGEFQRTDSTFRYVLCRVLRQVLEGGLRARFRLVECTESYGWFPTLIYRNTISKDGEFPPAAHRYHLYVAYACPWANRALVSAINDNNIPI